MPNHMQPNCERECGCTSDCVDPCPVITLFRQKPDDPCRIEWFVDTCGDLNQLQVQLWDINAPVGNTKPIVPRNGEMFVSPDSDYRLVAGYPGCQSVERTIHVDDNCPCLNECWPRRGFNIDLSAGKPVTATIVVTGFQNITRVTYPYAQAIFSNNCQVTLYEDLTLLNHTATFRVIEYSYLNDDDRECVLHYILPVRYYLGRVTTRIRAEQDLGIPPNQIHVVEEGSATFDFYGVIPGQLISFGHSDTLLVDAGFALEIERVDSDPIVESEACKIVPDNGQIFKPTLYAPYDFDDRLDPNIWPISASCWIFRKYGDEIRLTIWTPNNISADLFPPWCVFDGPWNGLGRPWGDQFFDSGDPVDQEWSIAFTGIAILFGAFSNVGKIKWVMNAALPNLPKPQP